MGGWGLPRCLGGGVGFPWAGGGTGVIPHNVLDKIYLRKVCLEVAYNIFLTNVFQILHSDWLNLGLWFCHIIYLNFAIC